MPVEKIIRNNHTLDATNQSAGRLATKIVELLRGKHKTSFAPHIDAGDFVHVLNADKLRFTGKKLEQEKVYSHSLYPGGLKEKPLKTLYKENPGEVIKKTVWNMLPKNRLREKIMKRLIVK